MSRIIGKFMNYLADPVEYQKNQTLGRESIHSDVLVRRARQQAGKSRVAARRAAAQAARHRAAMRQAQSQAARLSGRGRVINKMS